MSQLFINEEHNTHVVAKLSLVFFKIEFISQATHRDLEHIKQFAIFVHTEHVVTPFVETRAYPVSEMQLEHNELVQVTQ